MNTLPTEVRLEILKNIMPTGQLIKIHSSSKFEHSYEPVLKSDRPCLALNMLLICKTITREALDLFYGTNTFEISNAYYAYPTARLSMYPPTDTSNLVLFTQTVKSANLGRIRYLDLHLQYPSLLEIGLDLVEEQFSNLKKLRILGLGDGAVKKVYESGARGVYTYRRALNREGWSEAFHAAASLLVAQKDTLRNGTIYTSRSRYVSSNAYSKSTTLCTKGWSYQASEDDSEVCLDSVEAMRDMKRWYDLKSKREQYRNRKSAAEIPVKRYE